MSDYEDLKKAAESSTLGPWEAAHSDNGSPCICGPGIELIGAEGFLNGPEQDWLIASFIAAANPKVILEMIGTIGRLNAELESLRGEASHDVSTAGNHEYYGLMIDDGAADLAISKVLMIPFISMAKGMHK